MEPLERFAEAAAAASVEPVLAGELVMAAAIALTQDLDTPSLRELSSRTVHSSWYDLAQLVEQTLVELGDATWWGAVERRRIGALRFQARRVLTSRMPRRDLLRTIHETLAWDTPDVVDPLLQRYYQEDLYDDYAEFAHLLTSPIPGEASRQAEMIVDVLEFLAATELWRRVDYPESPARAAAPRAPTEAAPAPRRRAHWRFWRRGRPTARE